MDKKRVYFEVGTERFILYTIYEMSQLLALFYVFLKIFFT